MTELPRTVLDLYAAAVVRHAEDDARRRAAVDRNLRLAAVAAELGELFEEPKCED